ncbi:ABC transporter G family member 7 [Galdieria sulphuraria]|nr:ABC transporter G family member 7 [Galdieria sulphuraria]
MARSEGLSEEIVLECTQPEHFSNPPASQHLDFSEIIEQTYPSSTQRQRVSFQFEDICVSVTQKSLLRKRREEKVILQNVSGAVHSGQLLAIMGPSGSGKTTLLNALAGRLSASGNFGASGRISVNGKRRDPVVFKKVLSAYVMQDENLFAELTVEEQINIAASLRLPRDLSKESRESRVEAIISELGLVEAKKTLVGSETKKGISGGERKRVSIGIELVRDPSLIFLDEPTSGLDAFNAQSVVNSLVCLARKNRAVLMTIHQPRSDIFSLIDSLLLLSEGKVLYFGPAKEAVAYFSQLGYECPLHFNPADYILDLIAVDTRSSKAEQTSHARLKFLHEAYKENSCLQEYFKEEEAVWKSYETMNAFGKSVEDLEKHPCPYWKEFSVLLNRAAKLLIRERNITRIRVFQTLFLSILIGLIWLNKGRNISSNNYEDIEGVLYYILISTTFTTISSGMYRVSAYYLSKTLVEIPRTVMFCLLFCVTSYWMVGLRDSAKNFFLFFIVVLLTSLTVEGIVLSITAGVAKLEVASALTPLAMNIALLFGGFFLSNANIPNYFVWLKFSSFVKYSFGALMHNQFVNFKFQILSNTCVVCDGNEVLKDSGISDFSFWGNVGILFMLFVVFRIATYVTLRISGPKHDNTL